MVSIAVEGPLSAGQVGDEKTNVCEPLLTHRKNRTMASKPGLSGVLDGPPEVVASWQEAQTEEGTVAAPLQFGDAADPAEYDRNLNRVRIAREVWELNERYAAAAFADMGNTDEQRRAWFEALADVQRRINGLMERYGRR